MTDRLWPEEPQTLADFVNFGTSCVLRRTVDIFDYFLLHHCCVFSPLLSVLPPFSMVTFLVTKREKRFRKTFLKLKS